MSKHLRLSSLILAAVAAVIVLGKQRSGEDAPFTLKVAKPSATVPAALEKSTRPQDQIPLVAAEPQAPPSLDHKLGLEPEEKKELTAQLEDFDHLYKKLLKTEEEREEYQASLRNKKVFQLIKKALLHPQQENAKLQDTSLNFLMAAAQVDRSAVSVVMAEIIADDAIENKSAPRELRQKQAELKAEIIYQWTSMYPDQAAHVASLLPGSASQNIWRNVQNMQASNEAEGTL